MTNVDAATPPERSEPVQPDAPPGHGLGALLGLCAGLAGAFFVYREELRTLREAGRLQSPVQVALAVTLIAGCGAGLGAFLSWSFHARITSALGWLSEPVTAERPLLRPIRLPARPRGPAVASLCLEALALICILMAVVRLPDPLPFLLPTAAVLTAGGLVFAVVAQRGRRPGAAAAFAVGLVLVAAVVVLVPRVLTNPRRDEARKNHAVEDLKIIVRALRQYRAEHGRLPPVAVRDAKGNSLLSWRVLLLPYLGEPGWLQSFRLDQGWDSPTNYTLGERCPAAYAPPAGSAIQNQRLTYYQALVGPSGDFAAEDPKAEVPQCAWVVEAWQPVIWTMPADAGYASKRAGVPPIGGLFRTVPDWLSDWRIRAGAHAAFADGSVRFFEGKHAAGPVDSAQGLLGPLPGTSAR